MATATVSMEIICPNCGKRMAKKNWKDHARNKHTMTEETIQKKYEQLLPSSSYSSFDKPTAIVVRNFFSVKKFATSVSTSEQQKLNDDKCDTEFIIINDGTDTSTKSAVDSTPTAVPGRISESDELLASTIDTNNTTNKLNEDKIINNDSDLIVDHQEIINEDDGCVLHSTSNMTSNTESQNNHHQSSVSLQPPTNTVSNLSNNVIKSIKGVKFINAREMMFIEAHRAKYPNIEWNPHCNLTLAKPSPTWFTDDHPWLRAIHSDNYYGLLCADCVEFASSETAIKRNNGAFVVRPHWKLKHKGLEGIKEHKKSDLHRMCVDRRTASKIVSINGSVAGQLQCVNLDIQTRKYLRVLVQTLWKIIQEEMALTKFKPLVEFLHQVKCPDIVDWFKISNVKERYWSWEAIAEWLQSINKYIYHLQTSCIRKTRYINLIMDETRDITVKQMLSLCLRYVEEDTGQIHEEIFMIKPINDTSGEGIFNIAQQFIEQLQKDIDKELIITAQTYDGASSMRFQAQGHIRSRLSAWGMYIYCRSHLLNLSVEDAIENAAFDAYDTVHATLVFLRDSSQRLQVLFESQKLMDPNAKEQTVPKSSDTRWAYAYEIINYICKHYIAVVITLSTISQQKGTGSSDGRRYALDLIKPDVIFQIHLIRDVLHPTLNFLRQIEKRDSCLDDFVIHVDAARNTIKQSIEMFDFNQVRTILNDIRQYSPVIQPTFRSTRTQHHSTSADINEEEFRVIGKEFINNFLESLDNRFNNEARQLIENISILSSPSKCSFEQLLQNPLILQYCFPTTYKHTGVDRQTYERSDPPLLNFQELKNDVFAFLTIVGDLTSIAKITQHLALHGSEQCSEWYKLYQILATFAVGSNEAERTFSALRRTKSYLRNSLSDQTLEILIKMSMLKVDLTDDAIKFIIDDFVSNPQRAKHRNVSVFIEGNNETILDKDIF